MGYIFDSFRFKQATRHYKSVTKTWQKAQLMVEHARRLSYIEA